MLECRCCIDRLRPQAYSGRSITIFQKSLAERPLSLIAVIQIARIVGFQCPLSADTVEKLRFEINGDFICDLSVVLYSKYEGVVEVP